MPIADRTLARRATANLARGIGGSLPLALLPPLLARQLSSDEFAVWVLVVQFAGYVAYLELGLQMAVSKTVATEFAGGGFVATRGPADAGVRLLSFAALGGVAAVAFVAVIFPTLFDVPSQLDDEARGAFLVLGLAAAVALPASAAHGALLGIGRNDLSAFVVVVCRLPSVILTAYGASIGWSIPRLAMVLAAGSVANGVLSFVVSRLVGIPVGLSGGTRPQRREIIGLTATFGVFTVATLLVTGVDVIVVGFVDFEQVAAYGLGASLVTVLAAAYTMVSTVLLPAFADAAARGELAAGRRLAVRATQLSSWLLAVGFVFAFAVEPLLFKYWAGPYADDGEVIFQILLAATALRLSVSPISQWVIGAGNHRWARLPAAGEALLNLVLSIALGVWIGAIGVAIATFVAAGASAAYYLVRLAPMSLGHEEASALTRVAFGVPIPLVVASVLLILVDSPVLTVGVVFTVTAVGAARINTLRGERVSVPSTSPVAPPP